MPRDAEAVSSYLHAPEKPSRVSGIINSVASAFKTASLWHERKKQIRAVNELVPQVDTLFSDLVKSQAAWREAITKFRGVVDLVIQDPTVGEKKLRDLQFLQRRLREIDQMFFDGVVRRLEAFEQDHAFAISAAQELIAEGKAFSKVHFTIQLIRSNMMSLYFDEWGKERNRVQQLISDAKSLATSRPSPPWVKNSTPTRSKTAEAQPEAISISLDPQRKLELKTRHENLMKRVENLNASLDDEMFETYADTFTRLRYDLWLINQAISGDGTQVDLPEAPENILDAVEREIGRLENTLSVAKWQLESLVVLGPVEPLKRTLV